MFFTLSKWYGWKIAMQVIVITLYSSKNHFQKMNISMLDYDHLFQIIEELLRGVGVEPHT